MTAIKHLLIVAGPSGCGKTTLIRRIASNRLPMVDALVGVEGSQWTNVRMRALIASAEPPPRIVLHYDFLWSLSGLELDMSEGLSLLDSIIGRSERVSVLTIWTPQRRLQRQFIEEKFRTISRHARRGLTVKRLIFRLLPDVAISAISASRIWQRLDERFARQLPRQMRVVSLYSSPEQIVALYRRWFDFCRQIAGKMQSDSIIELDTHLRIRPREAWEREASGFARRPDAGGESPVAAAKASS